MEKMGDEEILAALIGLACFVLLAKVEVSTELLADSQSLRESLGRCLSACLLAIVCLEFCTFSFLRLFLTLFPLPPPCSVCCCCSPRRPRLTEKIAEGRGSLWKRSALLTGLHRRTLLFTEPSPSKGGIIERREDNNSHR
eukprot:756965-Hanusia_phi.AAC.1